MCQNEYLNLGSYFVQNNSKYEEVHHSLKMGAQTYLPVEILDYVETHTPAEEVTFGISQRELAKALGYHPCSMSRPLATLVSEGLLLTRRGLVRDGSRKQLTYRLTESGRARLHRETRQVPLLSGDIPPPPHPFLGRKEELTLLTDHSREGGAVFFVDGAPGMGKTALVSRHLRRIKQGRVPFWFTVRPASSSRQFVVALSHALSALGASQLAYYTQLPRPPVPREVADLTARALAERSLAAVIDDTQMAGPDVRKFLEEFITALMPSGAHLFYLISQEPPIFESSTVATHRLTVGGLDRAAAHDLTDRQGGLADRFETVFQATLGSPLLLQLAVSNPGLEADAATLPQRVVERLHAQEVQGLLPVALSNEPMPLPFVTESGELGSARVHELTKTGLLQKTLQGRLEVLQVVRTALLSRVTQPEERAAHLRLAAYYGRSHRPEAVRERFLHLVAGESWKLASQLLTRHQRTLLGLGFSEPLRNSLRRLSTALPRGTAKARALEAEAVLLRYHSDYSEAIIARRRAVVESNADPKVSCEAHLHIAELYMRLRDVRAAENEFAEAQKIGSLTRRLQVFFGLTGARLAEAKGDNNAARLGYQETIEMARRYRITDLGLDAIAAWSRLEELQTGPESALMIVSEAIPEAQSAGRADIVFNLRLVRAHAYLRMGQGEAAESEMRTVRSEAESLGYLNQLTYTLDGMAAAAGQAGRWTEAIGYARHAMTLAEKLGNDHVLGHALALLCSDEFRQAYHGGDPALLKESIAHGERSVEVLGRLPPSDLLVFAHGYLAEVYAHVRDGKRASEHYARALELTDQLSLGWAHEALAREVGPKVQQSLATA